MGGMNMKIPAFDLIGCFLDYIKKIFQQTYQIF